MLGERCKEWEFCNPIFIVLDCGKVFVILGKLRVGTLEVDI